MTASCFTQKFWLILQLYKYLNVRVCTVRIIDKKIKQMQIVHDMSGREAKVVDF
jgi:hypothetical protein